MPKYDCKELEVHEQYFQVEKSVSVKNTGAHFSLNISANQRFGTYAERQCYLNCLNYSACTPLSFFYQDSYARLNRCDK